MSQKPHYTILLKFENNYLKDIKYRKGRDHCDYSGEYGGTAHSICNLRFSVPKKKSYGFS